MMSRKCHTCSSNHHTRISEQTRLECYVPASTAIPIYSAWKFGEKMTINTIELRLRYPILRREGVCLPRGRRGAPQHGLDAP